MAPRVVLLFFLLALPLGAAAPYVRYVMVPEIEEPSKEDLDLQGQHNCVLEASDPQETYPSCPIETNPYSQTFPPEGVRILDSFYITPVGFRDPSSDLERIEEALSSDPSSLPWGLLSVLSVYADFYRGTNVARAWPGSTFDVILPGAGKFEALYGLWGETPPGDGVATVMEYYGPGNEFVRICGPLLVSYVDPGSHPPLDSKSNPDPVSEPDIYYTPCGQSRGVAILFLDGSLLQSIRVTTVSDALLSPSCLGNLCFPFTPSPTSLVDIDVYMGLFSSTPFEGIWRSTGGALLDSVGSPHVGMCPDSCSLGPWVFRPLPPDVRSILSPVLRETFPPYSKECLPDEGSSASLLGCDTFVTSYRAYSNLLPRYRPYPSDTWLVQTSGGTVGWGPLPARSSKGEPTLPPGDFTFDGWVGVWSDLNGDGFVGDAGEDPYLDGTRPIADDFLNPRGEFYGAESYNDECSKLRVVRVLLIPDTDWGGGVFAPKITANCAQGSVVVGGYYCSYPDKPALMPPNRCLVTGSDPIVLLARYDDSTVGHLVPWFSAVYMPMGSAGFTFCMESVSVRFSLSGVNVEEGAFDCDHVPRYGS